MWVRIWPALGTLSQLYLMRRFTPWRSLQGYGEEAQHSTPSLLPVLLVRQPPVLVAGPHADS